MNPDLPPLHGTVEKVDKPLPPENYEGCTCPVNCNIHEETTDDE